MALSSVQSLSRVRLFATPWTAAHQAFLSITNSQGLHKLMSFKSVMPSNHLHPLSSPSPPAFNLSQHSHVSFPMSQFFASGGQSIEVSASESVLPMNIQEAVELESNTNLPSSYACVSSLRSGVFHDYFSVTGLRGMRQRLIW